MTRSNYQRRFEEEAKEVYPCVICKSYDGGSYVVDSAEDERQEMGITVLSRACKSCWQDYMKFIGSLDNYYKYAQEFNYPHPWPPENSFVRNFVIKNPKIRKSLLESGFKV